jgi:hypothetical protein
MDGRARHELIGFNSGYDDLMSEKYFIAVGEVQRVAVSWTYAHCSYTLAR